jgi:hypothetical protein
MNAKATVGLAVLLAALLLNPVGICAAVSFASLAAHPCCPITKAPMPENCTSLGCIQENPVIPPVPTSGDIPPVALLSNRFLLADELAGNYLGASTPRLFSQTHRFLNFHQLLI